jgi:glycosyltransferase involved in cell wall biosynthesis
MKISVITPRYSLSGVPLAQFRLAKALLSLGHEVILIVGYVNHGYKLPDINGVDIQVLGKKKVTSMITPLVKHLKKYSPDVVFSAEDHLNAITLLSSIIARSSAKISCSSRVTPFDTYSNKIFTKRWILKQLMKLIMNKASVLTCVSKDMVDQYKVVFNNPPHICIYNIVVDSQAHLKMIDFVDDEWFNDEDTPMVIAAGRLAPWKGFADLIYAIKELNRSTRVKLTILGGGPLKGDLELLIKELNLESVVKLKGYVDNTLKYFKKADVFVLSSYVEGLPNVLVESMMCGCTPVSTDCPTGPREVLERGKYGYLTPVGDIKSMAKMIKFALDNPIENNILQNKVESFSEFNVLEKHQKSLKIPKKDFFPKKILG